MSNTVIVEVRRLLDKNKAVAAGLTAFSLALAAALANLIETGDVDWTEARIAGGGLVAALIVAGVTYLVSPGSAEVDGASARGLVQPDSTTYRPPGQRPPGSVV